ncbi:MULTISPECIES: tetratricopeptide repeat protein [unclassified Undibacterium]|uniref:tetratricopeptide repeat protein n=1 Tax=unclassified Undibacterium TaxID=2630295 RepID=UPI002AC8E9DA|nr:MULTISPECIES: tetratricopeptide repeat protein [unclassified Undibacterium]MEB0140406.1 tetratricopeptide repeat protein [Undibacterium sp. CCC2.1]MEB0171704.1 tetratricopeptide repeat protein [Undibacterium sp. CCC1.1]MEB0177425.1 tetratricopeptide repeat protein [Undibacterium sp. CCC3.4]MEB0215050.1 tetratricopeptide repeat protein [Undibacterium sp. 5I2]WPX45103.1 tetratricopeptide repeat protein [Undibacterium sp. CCC3.4]
MLNVIRSAVSNFFYHRGVAAQTRAQYRQAARYYALAVRCNRRHAEAWYKAGVLHGLAQRYAPALHCYQQALELSPQHRAAHNNCGVIHHTQRRLSLADAAFAAALAIEADFIPANFNLGLLRKDQGQFAAALALFERTIALDTQHVDAQVARALMLLTLGRLDEGWTAYEWRLQVQTVRLLPSSSAWDGRACLRGKTLLLYNEQGLGDALQFCRYIPLLPDCRLILQVARPLVSLLAQQDWGRDIRIVEPAEAEYDYHCSLMSLPGRFGTRLHNIPSSTAYLQALPPTLTDWQQRLGPHKALRVGLVWSGSTTHHNDRQRSIALADMLSYLPPHHEYHCLQAEIRAADLLTLQQSDCAIRLWHQHLHDFSATAALCAQMDLIISVDTSVAHLAAAMGLPVWILLAYVPDFRWLAEGSSSPWYRSARLLRQTQATQWNPVLATIQADLRHR